jgi:hypothetical protein
MTPSLSSFLLSLASGFFIFVVPATIAVSLISVNDRVNRR